jgi:hypothetical protein
MSDQDAPQVPPTTPKAEAHARLIEAGFTRLHINATRVPRCELWQNKHGKTVNVDYTDSTFDRCWTESLENALQQRDSIPASPFASLWTTLLAKGASPPKKK